MEPEHKTHDTPTPKTFSDSLVQQLTQQGTEATFATLEVTLDQLLSDGTLLEALPLGKYASGLIRIGSEVRKILFAKKLARFVLTVQRGHASDEGFAKAFKARLESEPSFYSRTISQLIEWIERSPEELHAEILGHLFTQFMQGNLQWERLLRIGGATVSTNQFGFAIIRDRMENLPSQELQERTSFLLGTGFLTLSGSGIGGGPTGHVTPLGRDLYKFAIKNMNLP